MKTAIKNLENKEVGSIDLLDAVFGVTPRRDILTRMVNYQLAKRRSGNHKTKGVSEVAGTTKKPWAQKGTGRARQGSLRSAQFRKGGIIFGPVVRDHAHDLTKKVRQLALRMALASKQQDGKLIILDSAKLDSHKTKALAEKFSKLGWANALIIDGSNLDENFAKAARNIPHIDVLPEQGANVYDILRRDVLVLTKNAVEQLQERLK
ncbi:MAG: 50S ribosomal protein L4 [Alphaproteobacteria bacterium]|nr:50S ribosomal protein L4 [Alphaproteobacteria bacterium]